MTSRERVLLVEDDELIGTMVEMNLDHAGYAVTWARSAEDARDRLGATRFDALLLDLMLPGDDGLALCAWARRSGVTTPALMLTVRDDVRTKVAALEGGVDDYLTKPFDVQELVARVRALIRRSQAAGEIPATSRLVLAGGELHLDALRWVGRDGLAHDLTEKEAHLLALLARSGGRTLTRSDVIEEVWGMDALPTERTVDNFILRLRRLVEDDPETPRHILTVRGRGYRWED
jgi:DNA-binding response OmpR family regulator